MVLRFFLFSFYLFLQVLVLVSPLHSVPLPTGVSEERLATQICWQKIEEMKPGERPRIILVLGGGGARGLSHIGVLRVLEQEKIPIDQVVGVSVGALIGALYSGGMSSDQIESMASEVGWNKLTDFSKVSMVKLILSEELLSSHRMESYLKQNIGNKFFSDLRIPFACVATDIRTGERVVFREGPVAIAARASATFPAIFNPVEYRHRYLVDGGVVDNLPTDVATKSDFDVVIGVLPKADQLDNGSPPNVFRSLVRTIEIQRDAILEEKKKSADFLIEPYLGMLSIIDLNKNKECIESGELTTRKRVLDLKRLIIKRVWAKKADVAPPLAER